MKGILYIIALIAYSLGLQAQSPLNSALGNFKALQTKGGEYTIITNNGVVKLIVYSPNIIRIRVVKETFLKTFSYAVIATPAPCNVKPLETTDKLTLETDSLVLTVNKIPLRFTFQTKDGKVINTDDPAFGTSWLGDEVTTYKTLQDGERFMGLGEHAGNLDRRGEAYTNWNTDDPGYNGGSKSLYSSIPFYIGLHHNLCYGIFLDNTSQTLFNFGAGNNRFSSFTINCGEMDYYFIYHKSVRKIIESYTALTGRMPMPPVWALGYQQCRYSYFPDKDVVSTAQKFRERNIPVDMMYFDIHYMDHYKLFTWDNERFPNPEQTIKQLKDLSLHLAVIIDPGVKVENNYNVYHDGLKNDIFIKYPDGTYYQGNVWPGWCHFPDFTMPKARDWWGKWVKTYADQGVTGFWNDMNEIAAWGKEVPKLIELNWEGTHTSYNEGKNVYGFQMARSTFEGAKKAMNGYRPFVLTRSGYAGLQRFTAIWTGDNQSTDDHMMLGVRLLNSMGLSGVSYTGMDVGGFSGNPSTNLYTRWMQIGTFSPMFRGHTAIYTNRTEPWAFGEIAEDIARRYMGFRYQLMPYIYSNFYESTQDGIPVLRSLAIDNAQDANVFDPAFQQQFLFGPSLLIAPVKSTDQIAKVYLPEGQWFDLFTDKKYEGKQSIFAETPIEKLPVFVKGGSIIPMQKLVESTSENAGDTLYLQVYAGNTPSKFTYYEDDGLTYAADKGSFYKRSLSYFPSSNSLEMDKKEGSLFSKFKIVTLVFHGLNTTDLQQLRVNDAPVEVVTSNLRYFTSRFKFADYGPNDSKTVLKASFALTDEKIKVQW